MHSHFCTYLCLSRVHTFVYIGPYWWSDKAAADLSPQDSAVISDIVEVGPLPCLDREDEETWHCFYIVTRYGLRIECASASEIQVNLAFLRLSAEFFLKYYVSFLDTRISTFSCRLILGWEHYELNASLKLIKLIPLIKTMKTVRRFVQNISNDCNIIEMLVWQVGSYYFACKYNHIRRK